MDPKIHIIRISARVGERKRLTLLDELRQRKFHIANPGKEEERPVTAEEPIEESLLSEQPKTTSKGGEVEEVTEESREMETVEDTAKDQGDEEEEDK